MISPDFARWTTSYHFQNNHDNGKRGDGDGALRYRGWQKMVHIITNEQIRLGAVRHEHVPNEPEIGERGVSVFNLEASNLCTRWIYTMSCELIVGRKLRQSISWEYPC